MLHVLMTFCTDICWPLSIKGGMFSVAPTDANKSWMSNPLSAMTPSPGSSLLGRLDKDVSSLSDTKPASQIQTMHFNIVLVICFKNVNNFPRIAKQMLHKIHHLLFNIQCPQKL